MSYYRLFEETNLNAYYCAYSKEQTVETKDNSQAQRRWTREEVCLLVAEYFRTKSLSNEDIERSHEFVSRILRNREKSITGAPISDTFRNLDGITLQSARIKCLDPDTPYSGMQGTKLQKEVVQEYLNDPSAIKAVAYDIIQKYS